MAKSILPVDFLDDVLSAGMGGRRRYRKIDNEDGSISLEDVTEYDQIGSIFGQMQINAITEAVNESADKSQIIDSAADLRTNASAGMMAGALAVKEIENKLNGNITALQNLMQSFNAAKSRIISSALGIVLGMTANTSLADIATKIASIVNRGTLNWSGNNTTFAVPAGYYPGGTLDSRPSYNSGYNAGVTAADNRANVNSANYKAGYNAGVAAGKISYSIVPYSKETSGTLVNSYSLTVPSGKTRAIVIASAHIVNHNLNNGISCTGGSTITEKIICKKDGSYDYCSYYRECTVSPGNVLTITASNTGSTHAIYSSGCVVFI